MKILIADDEAVIRIGLRAMLEQAGHRIVGTVTNGRAVLELMPTAKPDLVILDIKMPEMDGLETARHIMQKHPVPVVMLTAYSQRELVEQAKAAVVFGYLVKPVREDNLTMTLELARIRFKEWQELREQAKDLQTSLETRDVLDRAKRVLMERDGLSERAAFLKIRRQSRANRVPMLKIAQKILSLNQKSASHK